MRTFGYIMLGVFVIGTLSLTGFALGWVGQPFRIFSPENVREQWRFAYDFNESLTASGRQTCSAESALKSAESEQERTARRSQLLAYEQNYARIEAAYNARLRNAFEAGWVKPSDVPRTAPTLEQTMVDVCKL
jgi:hypothetical protein